MKKNRLQRLQEDMNEDLQKYLDEDLLDTTPKRKKESTFWMTVDNVAYPHQLVIDLSKVETVTGFRYLPRAEKNYPGMIKEYRVYVKPADFKY